mmetsp:Transcript_33042/g.36985  ORF Transcript_33042/g.36985 Transcript_33042/m.36985 type:complete len:360 (+) Transcript_33042:446-1525(+)
MSLHMLVQGAFRMYGTYAIPISTTSSDEALNASGTTTTCTVQGFVLYVCTTTSFFYYSALPVYSYVNVMNNFDKAKYLWIEWYIHVIVHIFPIGSAIYILTLHGFNNTGHGFCGISNVPLGCEEKFSNVTCERGPETNETRLRNLQWFGVAPDIFVLLFPTIVMVILYLRVKQRQAEIHIQARTVACQSIIYLGVMYIVDIPFLIGEGIELASASHMQYGFNMFAIFLYSVWSFFIFLVYIYFTVPTDGPIAETKASDSHIQNLSNRTNSRNYIFSCNDVEQMNSADSPTMVDAAVSASATTIQVATQPEKSSEKYTFNIFDGTNANGAFSEFVHEGDSDDERLDNNETNQWSAVQDYI